MALKHYQMASNGFLFGLSIPRKELALVQTQKNRHHFATRCEVRNQVLQAHNRVAIYQNTIWSPDFIDGFDTDISINFTEKMKELELKVMAMIIDYENVSVKSLELLELIDTIERLGIGYRFRTSINRLLNKIVALHGNNFLRQNGYSVSQGGGKI